MKNGLGESEREDELLSSRSNALQLMICCFLAVEVSDRDQMDGVLREGREGR